MSNMSHEPNRHVWDPITSRSSPALKHAKYAALLLNHSLDHLNGRESDHFNHIWQNACLRVAVDGGANLLTSSHKRPEIISGDFDSVSPNVLNKYRSLGTKIIETPDQDNTDFTKAVQVILNEDKSIEFVIAFWSSHGRIDHVLANIDTLYKFNAKSSAAHYIPIFLLQIEDSVSWLLNKGSHTIKSNHSSRWCSLVPIGSPCVLTTSGLRWNLDHQILSFGSLISTSNEFDKNKDFVEIINENPILFSMDTHL